VVAPALAWRGRRLFDVERGLERLDLLTADRTEGGALLLAYRVLSS
jgi:hypothetical protein